MTDTQADIAKLREIVGSDDIAEFVGARGGASPEHIWLVYTGSGETTWAAAPDPNDDGEPSVGYVRIAAALPLLDAQVAEIARLYSLAKANNDLTRIKSARIAELEAALRAVIAVADRPPPPIKNPSTPSEWARTSAMHIGAAMLDVFPKVRAALEGKAS